MENNKPLKLTWRQWAFCYAGSLGSGGVTWWATGSPWLGGGVLVGYTAVSVFYLAGKARDEAAAATPEVMSRQQRRAQKRKRNNIN